jgi:hypothetical protein
MRFGLLAITLLAGSGVAFAQNGTWGRQDNRGYGNYGSGSLSNSAQQNGYRDGLERGRQDRSRNSRANTNNDEYRQADRGYSRSEGSRGQYKQAYRAAYQRGYNDGYNGQQNGGLNRYPRGGRDDQGQDNDRGGGRRDRGNGNSGYGNYGSETSRIAADYGYKDGVWYAQQDMARRRQQNPADCKGYKDADHGYNSSYNRDEFKQAYRQAFTQGYLETFRRTGY